MPSGESAPPRKTHIHRSNSSIPEPAVKPRQASPSSVCQIPPHHPGTMRPLVMDCFPSGSALCHSAQIVISIAYCRFCLWFCNNSYIRCLYYTAVLYQSPT
jgi:hypothetical protein